jgi:Phosphoglucomutase/phosphomannomutase, alpha/beta/alpha domain II/Phosphoglucomutase/phosphomannomutase, alpha/beta/alpha domain III/Phosphoglucomutase/phosphomannomutase, C-terminal domain
VALTALHGVGGEVAVETLRRAGFNDVHTVAAQFRPDPDFPTVAFPNPEEPGATDELLALATETGADVAIALDPDADRCAVGIPAPTGWRMLSGDETGWLLGDYILSQTPQPAAAVVASTVVSSRMLSVIAAHWRARHVETLTGFKWLARADADLPGSTLVYAYEEAIGHCVDPAAVRDKDGISAAVLVCDLVATLKRSHRSVPDALDDLARRFGVHTGAAVSRPVSDAGEAAALMRRLRAAPPARLAGFDTSTTDLVPRTDALIFTGGDANTTARVVVRPSGTEPKVKFYIEVRSAVGDDLAGVRRRGAGLVGHYGPAQGESARSELAVAGVTESRDDVGVPVEALIDCGGEQASVRRRFLQRRKTFRGRHHTEHGDVVGVAALQQADGVRHRAAGGQHRVEHNNRPATQVVRQGLQIRYGQRGFLVAGDADEAHRRLRQKLVRLLDHPESGPQHRHQQRRHRQARTGGLGQWCSHGEVFAWHIPGGLVDQHQRQVSQGGTEGRVVGVLVAQRSQPDCGQRVVNDMHIHQAIPPVSAIPR